MNKCHPEERTVNISINQMDAAKRKDLLNDAKAKAIIIQGFSKKHLDIIKDANTAKQMIKSLQDIFVRASSFSKQTLWSKLVIL